jgi:diguanylate cyclase (GGDEF)-like protein
MNDAYGRTVRILTRDKKMPDVTDEHEGRSAEERDRIAEARDERAEARDERAEARAERAEARDERAEAREERADVQQSVDPDGAATDRTAAARDRRGAASDRMQAAHDREAASTDRVKSASERDASSIDELTGAHRREAGMVELERETARAKRTKQPFVLAFIDVDGLKATNDSLGHAAGDELLRRVADTMRAHFRPYDLIVRFGGDEFVCGLLDLSMAEAAKRFEVVNADLAREQASVTAGFAELRAAEPLGDLIARADEALYSERRQRLSSRVSTSHSGPQRSAHERHIRLV